MLYIAPLVSFFCQDTSKLLRAALEQINIKTLSDVTVCDENASSQSEIKDALTLPREECNVLSEEKPFLRFNIDKQAAERALREFVLNWKSGLLDERAPRKLLAEIKLLDFLCELRTTLVNYSPNHIKYSCLTNGDTSLYPLLLFLEEQDYIQLKAISPTLNEVRMEDPAFPGLFGYAEERSVEFTISVKQELQNIIENSQIDRDLAKFLLFPELQANRVVFYPPDLLRGGGIKHSLKGDGIPKQLFNIATKNEYTCLRSDFDLYDHADIKKGIDNLEGTLRQKFPFLKGRSLFIQHPDSIELNKNVFFLMKSSPK